jgi:hypothetical protein
MDLDQTTAAHMLLERLENAVLLLKRVLDQARLTCHGCPDAVGIIKALQGIEPLIPWFNFLIISLKKA